MIKRISTNVDNHISRIFTNMNKNISEIYRRFYDKKKSVFLSERTEMRLLRRASPS